MTFKMSLFQLSQTPQECDVVNMGVIINHTRRAAAITFSLRFCQHSLLHVLFANIWISLSSEVEVKTTGQKHDSTKY